MIWANFCPRSTISPVTFLTRRWSGDIQQFPASCVKPMRSPCSFKQVRPGAFVSRALNTLQSVCDDQGVDGQTLRDRIRKLADRGEIPDALANVADCLMSKVEGSALNAVQQMHAMHVFLFDQLVRAMIEHVYVAPAELQDLAEIVALLRTK